jgi:DJ-1/PfpI family
VASSVKENQGPLTVGILIFEQVEVLDVAGPFEVFSVTRLNQSSPFRVLLVSERMDQVLANGGLRLTPDVTTDNCPELDLLIVPGGWGTRMEVRNNNLVKWIAVRAAKTRLTPPCVQVRVFLERQAYWTDMKQQRIGVLLSFYVSVHQGLKYVKTSDSL